MLNTVTRFPNGLTNGQYGSMLGDLMVLNPATYNLIFTDFTSFAASAVRLGRGINPVLIRTRRQEPKRMLELYDFEGCPYCRKVREALCELDLDYLEHPVGKGSPRRKELERREP